MQISRTLEKGTAGGDVKYVVEQLSSLGYVTGKDDQEFGDSLESAVKEFQKDYGLTGDGRVGPQTAAALRQALDDLVPGSFRVDKDTRATMATLHSKLIANVDELNALVSRSIGLQATREYRQFTLTRVEKGRIEMKFDPGVEVSASSLASVVPDVSRVGYIDTRGVAPDDPAAGVVAGIARNINANRSNGIAGVCYIDPPGICEPCSIVIVIVIS